MLLILALHANNQSLGEPTASATLENPIQMFIRQLFQQLCEVGVDVFVLISGWFGIKPKMISFAKLVFQVMFYSVGLFIIMYSLGVRLPILRTIQLFWMGAGYWFVPAYILLFALSPVLNSFVEHSNQQSVRNFLIVFFSLELLYGWAFDDFANFDGGYSAISFVGLYLLARYLRVYQPSVTRWSKLKIISVFLVICLLGAVITEISLLSGIPFLAEHVFGKMHIYTSPFVIIPSVMMILFFSKMKVQSKIINWLAASCFAIFLIHAHLMVRPYYNMVCRNIFESFSGLSYFAIIISFLLLVAIGCILVDKLRIACWRAVENLLFFKNKQIVKNEQQL